VISDLKYFKFRSVKYFSASVTEKEDVSHKYKNLIEAMDKNPQKKSLENEQK